MEFYGLRKFFKGSVNETKLNLKKNNPSTKSFSIALKIIIIVAVFIVLLMAATDGIVYVLNYNKIYDINKNNMNTLTSEMSNNFDSLMMVQSSDVERLAQTPEVKTLGVLQNNLSRQDVMLKYIDKVTMVKSLFSESADDKENIENVFYTGKDGVVVACTNSEYEGFDNSHYDYIKEGLSGNSAVSSVYSSVITGKPVITFISPVKSQNGDVIGVVGKTVFIDYFSKRLSGFKYMNKGYVFIVDSKNNIIYHPQKYYINKKNEVKEIKNILLSKSFFSRKSSDFIKYSLDNKTYIAYMVGIPKLRAAIILTDGESEIKNIPKQLGAIVLVITVLGLVVVIPLLAIMIGILFKPLNLLIKNTKEIAKGNLTVENKINRLDEVGKLSLSFNDMTTNIKVLLEEIKNVSIHMTKINTAVKNSEKTVVNGITVISNSMDNTHNSTILISQDLNKSFEAFNSIKVKIEGIKNSSEEMLSLSNEINKVNNQGTKDVKELIDMSNTSQESILEVSRSFKELIKSISDIKAIINMVSKISEKTHILGLNTSIEATRFSGETGSFNVIAGEIRKLSQSVESEMDNISGIIAIVDNKIKDTDKNIVWVREVYHKEISIITQIIDNYKNIFNLNERIAKSIKNVNLELDSVNAENKMVYDGLDKINNSYKELEASIDEIGGVIDGEKSTVNELDSTLEDMNNVLNKLSQSVDKFKV